MFRSRSTEAERQFGSLMMVLIALPKLMFGHTVSHGATAMLVWGTMGLVLTRRQYLIPRAIVRRPHEPRLQRWRNTVLLRLGKLPIGHGARVIGLR